MHRSVQDHQTPNNVVRRERRCVCVLYERENCRERKGDVCGVCLKNERCGEEFRERGVVRVKRVSGGVCVVKGWCRNCSVCVNRDAT